MDEIAELKARAIHEFTAKLTVPLLYPQGGHLILLGSGTAFTIASRYFLVTARHLFDGRDFDVNQVALLYGFTADSALTLGPSQIWLPDKTNVDILIIELQDPETIARLAAVWGYMTLENVSLDASAHHVAITGYPDERFEATHERISVVPVTLFAERLAGPAPEQPLEPPVPGLDVYYVHVEEAYQVGAGLRKVPGMKGVSGASICAYRERDLGNEMWHPSKVLRAVGVQSGYVKGKYIRSKTWLAVAQVFYKIDTQLAEAITTATGFRPPEEGQK
jgi:hypothetical protein